jgi:DNA-binding transcriptional LysR family regulator
MSDPALLRVFNAPAIRYFYEVARCGSFRKAAEQLHIAASAIHRHVGILEEQVGTRLFDRSPGRGGLKLTAAGEVLAHRLQIAMNEISIAMKEIEGLSGVQRGRVSIGTSDVLATDYLPAFLAAFKAEHPQVEVNVKVGSPAQAIELLLDHHLDVVLAFDVAPRIGLSLPGEFALKTCVLVQQGHPLSGKRSVSLAECTQYPLILPDETQYLRGILDRMFHEVGVKPAPFIATNSYALMRDLVDDGLGIAIQTQMPGYSTRRHPGVVYVPLRESLARYSILACCVANSRRLPITANLFVERLVAALERDFGKDLAPA